MFRSLSCCLYVWWHLTGMLLCLCNCVKAPQSPPRNEIDATERKASATGIQRVVLLTTRTADWFEQRGFKPAGAAHESPLLPESRRKQVSSVGRCGQTPLCKRRLGTQ